MNKITKHNIVLILAATWIPVTILVGAKMGALIKLWNPNDVNVTQDLAYLREILISSGVFSMLWVSIIIALCIFMYRQDGNMSRIRMPVAILLANLIVVFGIMLFREIEGQAEDRYSRDNGLPTRQERSEQLDAFFKVLEEQKKSE